MQLSLENGYGYTIRSYEPGEIKIAVPPGIAQETTPDPAADEGNRVEIINESLILSPTQLLRDWGPSRFDELSHEHFAVIVDMEPEVVLLGTGERIRFPEPELSAALIERGMGVEFMDSAAACRTYNILAGEGRRVVAAIIML